MIIWGKQKNLPLARSFAGLTITHFKKKTSSWDKLHRTNYIPLERVLISELEAVKRRLVSRESIQQALSSNTSALAQITLALTGLLLGCLSR